MSIEHSPARQGRKGREHSLAERRAFTINEFCDRWGYSRPHFYKMRKGGTAPATIGQGKAQRISLEAEARWLKRQERLARKAG
jgi:predicted DNA-binding transcriptional regulator AlpA